MNRVFAVTTLCLMGSAPAFAQTTDPGAFVTGGVFAAIDRASHSRSIQPPGIETPDLGGTTVGGVFGAGIFLAPRWSASVEFTLGSETEGTATNTSTSGTTTQITNADVKLNLASVLLGYHHTPRGRIRLGLLAGMSFVHQTMHTVIEVTFNPPLPLPPPINTRGEQEATTFRSAATVGLDVAIAATSNLDIVPNVRGHVMSGLWSIRPGAMIRWRF